jgi:hypothetical protein
MILPSASSSLTITTSGVIGSLISVSATLAWALAYPYTFKFIVKNNKLVKLVWCLCKSFINLIVSCPFTTKVFFVLFKQEIYKLLTTSCPSASKVTFSVSLRYSSSTLSMPSDLVFFYLVYHPRGLAFLSQLFCVEFSSKFSYYFISTI